MGRKKEVEQLEHYLEEKYSRAQVNVLIPPESGKRLEQVLKILGEKFGKRIYPSEVLASVVVSFIDDLYDHYVGLSSPPPPPVDRSNTGD